MLQLLQLLPWARAWSTGAVGMVAVLCAWRLALRGIAPECPWTRFDGAGGVAASLRARGASWAIWACAFLAGGHGFCAAASVCLHGLKGYALRVRLLHPR